MLIILTNILDSEMKEIRLGFSMGQIKNIIEMVIETMNIPLMIDSTVSSKLKTVEARITDFQDS
jgi:hypothetical protein